MIGGSLNVSLSNNPVFSGGHFVRVEPLYVCLASAVIRVYFAEFDTSVFLPVFFSLGSFILQDMF